MPRTQTANTGIYDFGAPTAEGVVLQFRVKQGCLLTARLENQSDVSITATLQVSPDASTWADTAATPNTTAVADVVIPPRQYREYQINLRQGQDNYLRLQASGGGRGVLQLRGDEHLEIQTV